MASIILKDTFLVLTVNITHKVLSWAAMVNIILKVHF